jgi:hypothetical protein
MPLPYGTNREDFTGLERLDRQELDDDGDDPRRVTESGLMRVERPKSEAPRE